MYRERGKPEHGRKVVAALCALSALVLLQADEVPTAPGSPPPASASALPGSSIAHHARPASGDPGEAAVARVPGIGPTEVMGDAPYNYEVAAGEIMIHFRDGVSAERIQSLIASAGSRIIQIGVSSGLYRLEVPVEETIASFSALMRAMPEVADAVPNAIAVGTGCPTGGTYQAQEWGLDRIREIEACASYAPGLANVVVAVLDTGVAFENYTDSRYTYVKASDLNPVTFVPGYDFVNSDSHPNDDHQHGTHIAGIIAARGKIAGVAPGVKIMPVKVLASDKRGTEAAVIEGIYYAVDHGANIVNMSLSFGLGYYPSPAMQDAITYATEHDVVVVASAGNDGVWGISYPAAFPDVISVGASRIAKIDGSIDDVRAPYSNIGPGLDLISPSGLLGYDVNKDRYPDGMLAQTINLNKPSQLAYWYYVGTSQAAAHVSGAAAWLLADGAAPSQVRSLLMASAASVGLPEFSARAGAGLAQIQAARDLKASGTLTPDPKYYVNMLPWLESGSSQGYKAVVKIQVIDDQARPSAGVIVAGSWFGSATSFQAVGLTDANGFVQLSVDNIASSSGVAVGFQADLVAVPGSKRISRPTQFYSLSPASAELYSRLLQTPSVGNSVILFKLEASDAALDGVVNRSRLQTSYVMKPVGPGLRAGPLVVVFDSTFAPEVASPAASTVRSQNWAFPTPLYSGRGMVSSMSGTLVSSTVGKLGAFASYLILPLDPAMPILDAQHSYPVLNASPSSFLSSNEVFGNGFASSSLGSGFASSSWGSGFASSSWGSGFASSSLGNGFASSSWGSGFASSSLGSGFASSSLGSGFASSSLGSGFASSSWGSGFASSSLGSGFASSSLGSGSASNQMSSANGSPVSQGSSLEDVDSPSLDVEDVDPSTLITEETATPTP